MKDTVSDLHYSKVLERPKVIYNDKTRKFVMWLHLDSNDYYKAAAGVAVSDSPTGNFTYLGSIQPNNAMSRDMTLFKDEDRKAYHVYSSENNETLYVSQLTEDYLKPSGKFTRNFIKASREAPAVLSIIISTTYFRQGVRAGILTRQNMPLQTICWVNGRYWESHAQAKMPISHLRVKVPMC